MDPALFVYHKDNSTIKSEVRNLSGILSTHVDDSLATGSPSFKAEVEKRILQKFTHGSSEELPVRYVGFNVKRLASGGLTLDQDHYVGIMELPDISGIKGNLDDILDEEGQTIFRSLAAKLNMLSVTSRPDMAYVAKLFAMIYTKATLRDLRDLIKQFKHVKEGSTMMTYPDLGPINQWAIVGFSDAANKPAPYKIGAIEGLVLIIANTVTGKACLVKWRSKTCSRAVHSSMASESYAMLELLGEMKFLKAILCQMYGRRMNSLPSIAITDSKNLWDSLHAIKNIDDKILLNTIIEIKEAMCVDDCAQEIRHLPKQFMLADCLTKGGVSGSDLMTVLQHGRFVLEGGWNPRSRMGIFSRTWKDLQKTQYTAQHVMWAALRFANNKEEDDTEQVETSGAVCAATSTW